LVRQGRPDVSSAVARGPRVRREVRGLIQQRFERVGCPAAINGLHRDFQGPIQAREVTLGDLLAEQSFDRRGEGGRHGTLAFLRLRRASFNGLASSCAWLRQCRGHFVRQLQTAVTFASSSISWRVTHLVLIV
jgi:hypothetical protein